MAENLRYKWHMSAAEGVDEPMCGADSRHVTETDGKINCPRCLHILTQSYQGESPICTCYSPMYDDDDRIVHYSDCAVIQHQLGHYIF